MIVEGCLLWLAEGQVLRLAVPFEDVMVANSSKGILDLALGLNDSQKQPNNYNSNEHFQPLFLLLVKLSRLLSNFKVNNNTTVKPL